MANRRAIFSLVIVVAMTGSVAAATESNVSPSRQLARDAFVVNLVPQFDGPLEMLLSAERAFMRFRTARLVRSLPSNRGSENQINGIQDGPDGVDPLGVKGGTIPVGGPAPANSGVPSQ